MPGQRNGYSCQRTPSAVAHKSVLVPNQAAFPDTARLANGSPVMVPTLAHASWPAGLRYSS